MYHQMMITYGLQFLDKALRGYAGLYTFREDMVGLPHPIWLLESPR